MKTISKILFAVIFLTLLSCESQSAKDSANSSASFASSDINGTWKYYPANLVIQISGSTGTVITTGTAMPSGAAGGACMRQITYLQGGYWEATNYTYYTNGSWVQGSTVGLAMADDKKTFKIGSAVYTRQ